MHKRTNAVLRAMLGATLMLGTGAAFAVDAGPPMLPKQLAGPPGEFEAMRAPDPADAAILSRSALLPVVFDASGRADLRLPLHAGRLDAMLLSGGSDWSPRLVSPSGIEMDAARLAGHARTSRLGGEHDGQPGTVIRMDGIARGDWTLRLQAQPGKDARATWTQGRSLTDWCPGFPKTGMSNWRSRCRCRQTGHAATATACCAAPMATSSLSRCRHRFAAHGAVRLPDDAFAPSRAVWFQPA